MPPRSVTQVLAETLLGEPILPWLHQRKAGRSYQSLANELRDATDGKVNVTDETVRQWVLESENAA